MNSFSLIFVYSARKLSTAQQKSPRKAKWPQIIRMFNVYIQPHNVNLQLNTIEETGEDVAVVSAQACVFKSCLWCTPKDDAHTTATATTSLSHYVPEMMALRCCMGLILKLWNCVRLNNLSDEPALELVCVYAKENYIWFYTLVVAVSSTRRHKGSEIRRSQTKHRPIALVCCSCICRVQIGRR